MTARDTALLDQLAAADRDAEGVFRLAADQNGAELGYGTADGSMPAWLAERVREIGTRAAAGRIRRCRHLRSPGLSIVALWRPDRLLCPACLPDIAIRGTPEDFACDGCGRPAGRISSGLIRFGPVFIAWGSCDKCRGIT